EEQQWTAVGGPGQTLDGKRNWPAQRGRAISDVEHTNGSLVLPGSHERELLPVRGQRRPVVAAGFWRCQHRLAAVGKVHLNERISCRTHVAGDQRTGIRPPCQTIVAFVIGYGSDLPRRADGPAIELSHHQRRSSP